MQRKGTFQWGSLNLFSIASDPGADLDRYDQICSQWASSNMVHEINLKHNLAMFYIYNIFYICKVLYLQASLMSNDRCI
jgi:hypothetical protein